MDQSAFLYNSSKNTFPPRYLDSCKIRM